MLNVYKFKKATKSTIVKFCRLDYVEYMDYVEYKFHITSTNVNFTPCTVAPASVNAPVSVNVDNNGVYRSRYSRLQ